MKTATASAIAVASALIAVGPAYADDQSFLAQLASQGITDYWGGGPDRLVYMGHQACTDLRNGTSPQTIVGFFGPLQAATGQALLSAAQTQLCPDTLH